MKEIVKEILFFPVRIALKYVWIVQGIWPGIDARLNDVLYTEIQQKTSPVSHRDSEDTINLKFFTPNEVCRYRVATFETKEPETLKWIEKYGGGVFYDIGANIGLFSVFYAKKYSQLAYAFEPSALNLGQLAKNIALNEVSDNVIVVPMPLSRESLTTEFKLSMLDEGGSMSQFGLTESGTDPSSATQMTYQTAGLPLDSLVGEPFNFPLPSLIKIDVDGLEDQILLGAKNVLRCQKLKSVLIEVDENYPSAQHFIEERLHAAGFTFVGKDRSAMFDNTNFANSYNQIWERLGNAS